ncbi:hypothetical protein E2C01_097200 [Portunus trituberculatus]|uniref:Uncharacterized protein n=1 Tax=Portunus trituberculatus TaxID=210409 RepID=A0A5B7JUK1_PORTR|nr:hypothetical protein [Portunus trituberculatus]
MAASKVRQYVLLPFLLALVSALNAVLTLASLLPWFKKARHRFFLRVAEVQENNAMGKLWEEVGDVEYFWPRMKELWYRLDQILRFTFRPYVVLAMSQAIIKQCRYIRG